MSEYPWKDFNETIKRKKRRPPIPLRTPNLDFPRVALICTNYFQKL